MTTNDITYGWETVTFSVDSLLHCTAGLVYYAPTGQYDLKAGIKLNGPVVVAAGSVLDFRGPGSITYEAYNDVNSPSAFASADWSVDDAVASGKATITISALPDAGGFTITAIEWSNDDGATWTALTRKTVGTEDITTASDTILLRLVTVQGTSAKSAGKAVTVS